MVSDNSRINWKLIMENNRRICKQLVRKLENTEVNKNENKIYQDVWYTAKAVLKGNL